MLEGEPPARAAEAGLDLVANQKCAMAATQRLGLIIVIVGGPFDALALDGLDDQGRDVVLGEFCRQRRNVAHGHVDDARQKRAESFMEEGISRHGQRAVGQSVVGVLQCDDARARGRGLANLSALDRLRAAVAEEHRVQVRRALRRETANDFLRQYAGEKAQSICTMLGRSRSSIILDGRSDGGMIAPHGKTPKPERKSR